MYKTNKQTLALLFDAFYFGVTALSDRRAIPSKQSPLAAMSLCTRELLIVLLQGHVSDLSRTQHTFCSAWNVLRQKLSRTMAGKTLPSPQRKPCVTRYRGTNVLQKEK